MQYTIRFGVPEMQAEWDFLNERYKKNILTRPEKEYFNKLVTALKHLGKNPKHPGFNSHEIKELSSLTGVKIFESYIENDCPRARRIFWAYGPERAEITLLGSDNHLNKNKGYLKVRLSKFPR